MFGKRTQRPSLLLDRSGTWGARSPCMPNYSLARSGQGEQNNHGARAVEEHAGWCGQNRRPYGPS
eukprot:14049535-Alexandrium_andersonii.AAC.1